MTYAVRFEDVSKRYTGGGPRYPSLRHDVADGARRLLARLRGERPEPRGTLALDRVSFEVKEGEAFAIIGPNGAGKTTALRLIARITYPTSGRLRVRGRVAALIEIGSGIHPELTARENIWLYGQILGMSKTEIRRRFDEIVDFAGLEYVLDTPVKMYSSGMQIRLGFAIASHLEPDIFVVDEALAIGDAAFQAKCIERMTRLVAEGRTLIFVSHSLPLVREVCNRGLLLEKGRVVSTGPIESVIQTYLKRVSCGLVSPRRSDDSLNVTGISVTSLLRREGIATEDPVRIRVEFLVADYLPDVVLGVGITDGRPGNLISMSMLSSARSVSLHQGKHVLECLIERLPLLPGAYEVWFSAVSRDRALYYAQPRPVGTFFVIDGPEERRRDQLFARTGGFGPLYVPYSMEVHPLTDGE